MKPLLLPGHRGERGLRERSARDSKGSRPFRDETIAGSSGKFARGSRGGGGGLRMYAVFHCGEAPAFLFLPSFFDASVLKRSFETERPPTNRGVSQAPEVTHERR